MQVVSGPIGRERSFRGPPRCPPRPGNADIPELVQQTHHHGSGAEIRSGAPMVRNHPSLRRWQRPPGAGHCRHVSGALRKQSATILQHVGPNPAGTRLLLRHPETDTEGHHGYHTLDGVVSRLSGARHRWRPNYARRGPRQSALLGIDRRRGDQRAPAHGRQPPAGWLPWQAHHIENMRSSPSAPRTPPCATFCHSSNAAS